MAYAAVISLKRTIERHINPTNPQITNYAYQKLKYLGNFFERVNAYYYRNINKRAINAYDAKIRDAVWKLEDVVESYVLYHSLPASGSLGCPQMHSTDEESVKQEVDSFLKTVKELKKEYNIEALLHNPLPVKEDDDLGGSKSATVGFSENHFLNIISMLYWSNTTGSVDVVSLVGMAGISKTHLARNIYQHPTVVRIFKYRAWVRAGPKAQTQNVLVDILAQIELKPRNFYVGKNKATLQAHLKRVLTGGKCLIVLDDIWATDVCSFLIWCLSYISGCSLLLTTRLEEVAKDHTNMVYQIPFLNKEDSWNLLRQNVFTSDESFPPQLEEAGRKIAEKCEGLPLLILAVADILHGLEKTEEYWMEVADEKNTTFRDANNNISKVLRPSYEYLPQHLKACFLYLGVFPQKTEIPLSRITNLWIAEDFFEPSHRGNLQDFSIECLEELISNSVAIACQLTKTKLHTCFWHLCVKVARKNKFFLVLNKLVDGSKYYIARQRRLSVQNNVLFGVKEAYESMAATLTARSLLCTGPDHEYPVPICFGLIFLKVLDALAVRFYEFPTEVVKLLQLRYLALTHYGKLPCSISNLQELQCLILRQHHNVKLLRDSTCLPKEIWDLQELRHLRIMGSNLQDLSYGSKLPNLLTLHVNAHSCTKGVFKRIPNSMRKLGIQIELQPDAGEIISCFKNIMILGGLKSLKCVVVNPCLRSNLSSGDHLSNLPKRLEKLSLNGLGYPWKYIKAIGSLPNLKVLKLRCSAFRGAEWETRVGKFGNLEFLLLEDMDLMHWTIYGDKCFPSLRRLIIRHCYKLKMIPQKIGFIQTLKTMEVVIAIIQLWLLPRNYATLQILLFNL